MIILVPSWAHNYDEFWQAIRRRNLWFIKLRYTFAALLLMFLLSGEYILNFNFTSTQIQAILIIDAGILLYNVIIHTARKHVVSKPGKFNALHLSLVQSLLDLTSLLFLIYFTGTINSPLYMFFIFQMIIGSLILPGYVVYTVAALFAAIFSLMIIMQYFELLHSHLIAGIYLVQPTHNLSYVILFILVFVSLTFVSVYLANSIARRLYKREQEARERLEALNQAEIAKQKYIMGVVHEIKSPITAVQSLLDLILNKYVGPVDKAIEDKLSRARIRTDESLHLINNILRISKLKLLNITTTEELDIIEIVQTIMDTRNETAKAKNIDFTYTDNRKSKKVVSGDRILIELAISNVVSNALKYTNENGTVIIEINDSDGFLEIEISDNGIGIPPNELNTIFEQFYRASNIKKFKSEGSGLGLSLVKEVVERHAGKVEVKSPSKIGNRKQPGTTIMIKIPYPERVKKFKKVSTDTLSQGI
ncbi:MAG: HAMP domain-containing histidine kinase [Melioribacteraceae bacterium]|nr:HAMP domain-containing histidine kinase [Melioribacteraceae bacterium]